MCIHIAWLARHCSANYPYCAAVVIISTIRLSELMRSMYEMVFPFFLCLTFALFVSFFLLIFFLPCEIAHLDEGQMAQCAPKRALTPTSHLAAMLPHARVQKAKHRFCHPPFFPPITSLPLSPVLLSLMLTGTVATLPRFHNLAATQTSPNLKLIIYRCCLANCSIFCEYFECI